MHQRRIVFQRLHQIGLHRLLQQHCHGLMGLDITGMHGRFVPPVADDDLAQPLFQISQITGQTEDGHHFGGNRDIEAGFARKAVANATQRPDHLAQRTVIHVHHPAPGDTARIEILFIAPVNMVIDHRRQQVMRGGDGVEIAGEMQVNVFHRHDLRPPATGSATLDPETGTKRRLAHADHGLGADTVQPIHQADRGRGLALACWCRIDCRHQDELAILAIFKRMQE